MKILVVGATAAGTTFAAKMRRNDRNAQIIMIEKSETTSLGACGLPFYVGGFFDDPKKMIARTTEQFNESGIETRTHHEAIALDATTKTLHIKDINANKEYTESYDILVIATGAGVLAPTFNTASGVHIHTLRRLEDGGALHTALRAKEKQRVAIIGAGFIGIELVEGALALGHSVSLLDVTAKPMAKTFDEEVQELIQAELLAHGVSTYYGSCVTDVLADSTLVLENGQKIPADLVVWSAGIKPATDWLISSGINMERGVVQTNQYGMSSFQDVYAIGDCATVHHSLLNKPFYSPLATVANKAGRALADYLVDIPNGYEGMMGSASVKVCDLEVVRVGLTENEAKKYGLEMKTSFIEDKDHTNYYPDAQKIWIKLLYDAQGVVWGAQVAGKRGAALRGSALAIAVAKKVTVKELGFLDIPYSPPFSRTWDALNVAGNASK